MKCTFHQSLLFCQKEFISVAWEICFLTGMRERRCSLLWMWQWRMQLYKIHWISLWRESCWRERMPTFVRNVGKRLVVPGVLCVWDFEVSTPLSWRLIMHVVPMPWVAPGRDGFQLVYPGIHHIPLYGCQLCSHYATQQRQGQVWRPSPAVYWPFVASVIFCSFSVWDFSFAGKFCGVSISEYSITCNYVVLTAQWCFFKLTVTPKTHKNFLLMKKGDLQYWSKSSPKCRIQNLYVNVML